MDPTTFKFIEAIHHSPIKGVVAVTGGGTGAIAQLFGIPGASRTLLEAVVPYNENALIEFLGIRPESFCSAATGQALATRALERASWLAPGAAVVGVGCTASLATDRPKRGEHRFHIAACTADRLHSFALVLNKGARDRAGEELVVDAVLLNAVADAAGIGERLAVHLLAGEELREERLELDSPLSALLHGAIPMICQASDGRLQRQAAPPALLLPGAFNPLHSGHWQLAQTAARLTGLPPAFELSVHNVDKPPLTAEEVLGRCRQFIWRAPLWLTTAPTFLDKARLFPNTVFVVGLDTAERIIAPRYYQGSESQMLEALNEIRASGCRFLVAGRADGDRFRTLAELRLPDSCRELFQPVAGTDFRLDISSTGLRGKGQDK